MDADELPGSYRNTITLRRRQQKECLETVDARETESGTVIHATVEPLRPLILTASWLDGYDTVCRQAKTLNSLDYFLETFPAPDFVEIVGRGGGDTVTYRIYNDGSMYER